MAFEYSSSWLEHATLEEINTEREKVQAAYNNPKLDINYRNKLWDLLHRMDVAIGKKQRGEQKSIEAVHREHGRYLPNKD